MRMTCAVLAILAGSAFAADVPRAIVHADPSKDLTLTVYVAGASPLTITIPATGVVPGPFVPQPPLPPTPPVPPPAPDTMGLRSKVIDAARSINDPAGALALAAKAEAISARIRAGQSVGVQGTVNSIADEIKSAGPKWAALLVVLKAGLQLLMLSGKLSATDVQTWATLLDEVAAALREAAK